MKRSDFVKAACAAIILSLTIDNIQYYTLYWFVNPVDLLVLY